MKRLFALLLVVAMLLSLCVLPISAAEQSKMSVASFTTFTVDEDGYVVYGAPKTTPYEKDDLVAVKATFHNAEAETIKLMSIEMVMEYDSSVLEPYTWEFEGDTYGIAVFADSFKMEAAASVIAEGKSKISGASSRGVSVTAGATIDVAYYLFKVKNDIESGDAAFTLKIDELTKKGAVAGEADDIKDSVAIEENAMPVSGKAPTIGSTSVDKSEVAYGSDEVLTMGATSTSNKDITSFVTFKVKDAEGNDAAGFVVNNGNELNVAAADAGTYTVTAEPNGDNCRIDESVTVQNATFTITKQEITAPVVAISNFAKGQLVSGLTVETATSGLSVSATCFDEDGNQLEEERFKAGTTYSISIVLKADKNHVLNAQTLAVTVNGGDEQTVDIVGNVAVVTATTADKDAPTITPNPINATYGDLLSTLIPTGTATFNGKPVEGTFAWSNKYNAETPVGDAGEQTFNVVFTPAQQEVYATVTGTVKVNVAKKQITFTKSDYEWKSINDDPYTLDDYKAMCFQYDKNEHGIEPTCTNNDISDLVEFEVSSNNKSTNVIAATVTAKVLLKDEYAKNYKFDKDNTNIQSATLKVLPIVVNYDGEYVHSVEVCYTTSSVNIPLSAFGLPDEVLNDTNNKYWMRTDAVVAGDVDVISGTPTSFDEANRTLTLNLKSSLTKDDAGKTASVTLGLKVNNYETINPGVEKIADGEDKLFILKLNVKIIEKEDAGLEVFGIPETMVYGDTVRAGYPDGYYHTVKKEGRNATFSARISDTAVVAFDNDEGLAAKGVGTATITCTYESDTTFATKTFTINVTPKGLTANVSHDPITYGAPAPTEGYTVTFNGLLTGDVLADTDYTVGTEYKQGDPVGKYALTCVLNSETVKNYKLDTVNGELVVNKKELTDDDVTVTVLGETPVYDGSEKKPAVEVKYGETTLAAADYTVSYSNNVNAGVNTASVTVTSNDNSSYKFTATKNFTIAQAPISGAVITDIADVTYDTKAHTPEVTVMFNGSKLTDADYTVSYSEDCINAGTVTVTVTGKGNFTGTASKTFTINKAGLTLNPCTISELCTETDLKTRTLPSDFFLAGETETGFSIKLTAVEGGDDIFAVAPAVVEGENKITFRLKNEVGAATFTVTVTPVSGNYNGGSYALTISTHDRTDVSGSIEFKDGSAVYTGTGIKYENATISGYSGTLRYGYTPNASTGASLDASGLPLTVGTYTVAVTFNSDASFGYKTATFTITKATPTGTPGYTKLESSGKTLADAKLTVGTIRPAGTIAWDLPLTTVLEDGKAYAWTFTPNDTHNYTILTGTLVPYVDDGMDYIPGVIGGNTGSFNFHDVSRLDYFYDAVKWAAENGIASGTGRYTFSPNAVCTRAQTVTFLWRAAGSPLPRYRVCPFTDVNPRDYYYDAVLWAVEQGITTGLNATTFGPDVTVTRGQVATFLYRAASAAKPSTFNPFTDVKTTAYNYNAILWAYDNRITTGTSDTTFSPDAYCTRAQIVTFLYRYYQGR